MITTALEGLTRRAQETAVNRAYFDGRHPIPSASKSLIDPYREVIAGVSENHIPNIVGLCVDRLEVTGFTPVIEDAAGLAAAQVAWDGWQQSRMDLRAGDWLTASEVTGKQACLVVWPDSRGVVRYWPQQPEAMWAQMSEERPGEVLWAAKAWKGDDGVRRVTLYTTTDVQVWASTDLTNERPAAATYRMETVEEHPLGVCPVVAVELGRSDVDAAIGPQQALTKSLMNAAVTGEMYAISTRVYTGVEMVLDPVTGELRGPFEGGPNRTVFLQQAGDVAPSVTDLPGQNPTPFMSQAQDHRQALAMVTRTPAHLLLQGSVPASGLALSIAEAPFVAKVKQRQALYGAVIADAARLYLLVSMYLSTGQVVAVPELMTTWKRADSQAETDAIQGVVDLTSVGVPLEVALTRLLGWSQEEAAAAQQASDVARAEQQRAAGAVFDAGAGLI